ncbi:hypothetical protein KSP39_PZI015247 [Platanthera zijinensis]|uniref:Syntaxin 6/10/61 N-terminal domain-containing protein n=1 Tax=Platanthera zijinensis TaxID=2320716 RepID=A0AAP0G1Y4_9ASPA
MATAFERWEKDPFFFAAEEVQDSADRMESVYRRWMYGKSCPSKSSGGGWDPSADDLRRDLHAALGTAKWQLEELERAVKRNDAALPTNESTVTRHGDFIKAISAQIGMVEKTLQESNLDDDSERGLTWAILDKGERDELAIFLSSSGSEAEKVSPTPSSADDESGSRMDGETSVCSKNPLPFQFNDLSSPEMKDHRNAATSSDKLGAVTIFVSAEGSPGMLTDNQTNLPAPSLSNFSDLRTAESSSKPKKGYRNGFKKWRASGQEDAEEILPLRHNQLSRGMNECYEKSKNCLSNCSDDSCHKYHHDWFGAFQRQLRRSQYQIQYGRPVQMMIWTIVAVLLIFLFVLRAS